MKRRDATGHINPDYERELLEKARASRNGDQDPASNRAFISRARTGEELGEDLGESFIEAATSGEQSQAERHDQITDAEEGGPFVVSSASQEFAAGTDESNIAEATREPLPKTSKIDP